MESTVWRFADVNGYRDGFQPGIINNSPATHAVPNGIALSNAKTGFIHDRKSGSLTMERNAAGNNGDVGFNIRSSSSTFKLNVAISNVGSSQTTLAWIVKALGNSWQSGTWSNSSFVSVDLSTLEEARLSDGRVP